MHVSVNARHLFLGPTCCIYILYMRKDKLARIKRRGLTNCCRSSKLVSPRRNVAKFLSLRLAGQVHSAEHEQMIWEMNKCIHMAAGLRRTSQIVK